MDGSPKLAFPEWAQPLGSEPKHRRVFLFGDESWDYFPADLNGSKTKILQRYAPKVINIPGSLTL